MIFESLSEKLQETFKKLKGHGKLTEDVIRTVSSNVLQIQSSDINIEVGDDGSLIYNCHIVALFDDDEARDQLSQDD